MKSERQTRQEQIDLQLARAGWAVGSRRLIEELLIEPASGMREPDAPYNPGSEFADYALLDRLKRPLAIVEAKRTSRDALEGERQAADYADALRAKHGNNPFVFLANGDEIWFWHRDLYPPRKVSGFFTEDDLLRLAHLDKFGKPLSGAMPLERVIDRAYQIEAVKTIAERIEAAKRRFLLVLATGTGKTRVAVALVELLQRHERIQRVLFLADRRELVKQALGAFKEHLPGVARSWIEGGAIDTDAQIHFATYPGMMSLYQRLSPGYYDLIIADESHRSIYSRYKAILDHFDAFHLGLTATPTDFLDHNTFELFDCSDDSPTFYYGYDEAVRDKHLVPYRPVHVARTGFQIEGLKPGELPDDVKHQVREQGIDSQMERAEKTLDDFKNKDLPRVAISVDMLDTGIDVPSIRNLVFAKPVFSKVKFWQMLGRGTRTWIDPENGEKKADFLVIDHWDNFDYFQVNKDGRTGAVSEPLPTRLFRLRLEKLQILAGRSDEPSVSHTIRQLLHLVGTLPLENINVAPHADEIRALAHEDGPWRDLDDQQITATQLMFIRTLRQAVLQRSEVSSVEAMKRAPFNAVGDPEDLFPPRILSDILALTRQLSAA